MNKTLKVLTYCAAFSVVFVAGFAWKDIRAGKLPDPNNVSVILSTPSGKAKPQPPARVFANEYERIRTSYDKDFDEDSLLYSGLDGMMQSLGDPYTQYLEPVIAKEFNDSSQSLQFFGGIGARLWPDPLGVKVIQVFRGSPADAAGVRNGDTITHVNGEQVGGQTSDAIVEKIKGEVGTTVKIRVFRGQNNSQEFTIKRNRIYPPSADGNVLEGTQYGYVLVTGFEKLTTQQFQEAVIDLEKQNIKGLVIDLRGNPGGLLDTAQQMLSQFLDYKTVVQIVTREQQIQSLMSDGGQARAWKYPIVILVNDSSASAAEIFSGAMQVYGKATLVGEHTYGKASVQNVIPLSGGSSAKITIAHYRLPNGADISRKQDEDGAYVSGGIKPDVEVKINRGFQVVLGDPKTDNQLQKAIEILNSKRSQVH